MSVPERGVPLTAETVVVPVEPTEAMINAYFDTCARHGFRGHINATAAWSAMLSAAPARELEGGARFTSVTGLWKDQSLSRLERVRAHRFEFGSELKSALEAVDEEAARQNIANKASAPLLVRAREYVVDALDAHEHSDGRDLLNEIDAALTPKEAPAEPCKSCNGTGRELGSAFNRCADCEAPAATGAGERWHLGSMNDGLFIINAAPRPSGTDVEPSVSPNGPTMVLNVTDLPEHKAKAIVDAHNAALRAQPQVRS